MCWQAKTEIHVQSSVPFGEAFQVLSIISMIFKAMKYFNSIQNWYEPNKKLYGKIVDC